MTEYASLLLDDPIWLVAVKALLIFVLCVLLTLLAIWGERRIVARMQLRVGPNRVGPFGLVQGLADGVKLALKEDLIPKAADKVVFIIAPIISASTCFLAFAVIPMTGKVLFFGEETVFQLTDLSVGVLYILAAASVGVYGIVLAGWSSGSTYPLLGGLRSSAQVISYEIAMGLSFVAVFMYAGSMSTSEIVDSQAQWWNAVVLFPSFVIYVISMIGETNRAPFDLAEAEGELVGGFHTEYSSLKFALFFLFVWLRGTLPRLRYDQFMKFGWKVLIPVNIAWILIVATLRLMTQEGASQFMLAGFIITVVVLVMLATTLYESSKAKAEAAARFVPEMPEPSFPVPELPKQKRVEL